jgi:hypothetical protein
VKTFLLALLVLGLSVPAIADVFVYNAKQSGMEFGYDADTDAWIQSKSGDTTYIVIQTDSNSPGFVNICAINTWKEKDDEGVMYKYYALDGVYTISFLQTQIAKKNTWIISGTSSDEHNARIMVSGQARSIKIGSGTYTAAALLNGYTTYGDIESENIGGGPLSLQLNFRITEELVSSDEDITDAISAYFEEVLGYEPG